MSKPLSVLFVSSEVVPFVKVGGIADVSFSLPIALRDLGHDVRVILPKYGFVSERKNRIHEINRLKDVPIPMGKSTDLATIKSSSMNNPRTKVQAYVVTSYKYFDSKKGVYQNRKTGEPYPDNDERFIFFCRSVIETCLTLKWFPDIIHCNDWQSSLVPAMAKLLFPEEFKNTKFVFTVHTIREQGEFPLSTYEKLGFPESEKANFVNNNNKINFLKAGLIYADYVTTVSKTIAEEFKNDSKVTNGLNNIFKNLKNFKGIMNGIDPWIWNPSNDKLIKTKFKDDFRAFKESNKKVLLSMFGLEYEEDVPTIGMITRLNEFKGMPLVIQAVDKLFKNKMQLIILADGLPEMKKQIDDLVEKYPGRIGFYYGHDEELAHKIEAGSDMFLIPSVTEPCGLNAIYSLVYGTLPIVRNTGGLSEIVTEIDTKKLTGNGFKFDAYKVTDLMKAVNKALDFYNETDKWQKVALNAMKVDYSWGKKAEEYDKIYQMITK